MTNFLDLVNQRQSVRSYKDTPVSRELLDKCLEAARLAPSACNSQPWEFIVVDDPAAKDALCDAVFSGQYATNRFARKAPVLVAVVSEKGNTIARIGGFLRDTRYYLIDIGIAAEHFVLQASELGLGSCWLGWFNEKAARTLLGIAAGKRVEILIAVGYSAQDPRSKKRRILREISKYK